MRAGSCAAHVLPRATPQKVSFRTNGLLARSSA